MTHKAAALLALLLITPGAPPFAAEAARAQVGAAAPSPAHCDVVQGELNAVRAAVPAEIRQLVDDALEDDRLKGAGLGLSVWIEGYGVVEEVNPSLRLRPASTQKLLTAVAAFEVLGPAATMDTVLAVDGLVADGALHGDLYIVGGGDPTLTAVGPHSLAALAQRVRSAGVTRIRGDVVADESRYDSLRGVATWSEGLTPAWVGALSALTVDENRASAEAQIIGRPSLYNASAFRHALEDAGVAVDGLAAAGVAPPESIQIHAEPSPPVRDVVAVMLTDSNNTYAELLVKEIGYRATGIGSTAAGMAVLEDVAERLCLPETVLQQDGSGLSHGNARSVRAWRLLLQAIRERPWFGDFEASLAVGGQSGTLRFRFRNTSAEGNLRAKTGTITGIRALSGYLTMGGGRLVVFSAIVDDDEPRVPMSAVDDFLVKLAASGG